MNRRPVAVILAAADEVEVEVEKLVAGGDGLARYQGVPIFVARAAPGDRLRVRLVERRPDFGRAEIVEVLKPGPGRRPAPCAAFDRCGGCDLQHLDDGLQVELKAAAVRETLERLGGIVWPESVATITADPWAYRLRTQLHTRSDERGVEVGYFSRRSHDLVSVSACPVLVPELEALLAELPRRLGAGDPPGRIDLAAGDRAVTGAPAVDGLPRGAVQMAVGDFTYHYDARTFFQGHRQLVQRLTETTIGEWEGDTAYDLYAGVGLFTLPLARRYGKVVAVEGDRQAVRFARRNLSRNQLDRGAEVIGQAVETWIAHLPEGVDRVVVDPPRRGLLPIVRQQLLGRRPRRLTYVSCHAAALARDLRVLAAVYRLESITLVDLFPQTGHLEVVAQLVDIGA